jgi:citrate lyase subunit beta/citryl-CoA lyase
MRLVRSLLYTPGNRPKMIEKAPSYGADGVILDLADAVPHDQKPEARIAVGEAIGRLAGNTVVVKIGDPDEVRTVEDVNAVVRPGLTAIIVPKISRPEEIHWVENLITAAEQANGVPAGSVELIVLMETPQAVARGYEVASCTPRLAALVFGAVRGGDLVRELGCEWSLDGTERLYVKSKVLLDARAAGLQPLDGVFGGLDDPDGLAYEVAASRKLGYSGKLAIHPKQIETINRAFTPSDEEIAYQRRILEAFNQAVAAGSASFVLDGKFVDYAMAATAEKILALADAIGRRE